MGPVIAGFLAQGQAEELEEIARRIGLDFIVNVPRAGSRAEDAMSKLGRRRLKFSRSVAKDIRVHHGLDTTPQKDLLSRYLDEDRIRSSAKDLGVAACKISQLRPEEVFQDEMEPGTLIDYILASAAFQCLSKQRIEARDTKTVACMTMCHTQ